MVTIETSEGPKEGASLLDALDVACVFSVVKDEGRFVFLDGCDLIFDAVLTRDQVLALADELRALVEQSS